MNALIVYESKFGNTEQVARVIAGTLRELGTVQVVSVDEVTRQSLENIDLLLVGAPTQAHSVPHETQEWLALIPRNALQAVPVAAFDTRLKMNRLLSGSAAQAIAKALHRLGAVQLVPPESFFVEGREPRLVKGELERAANWALFVLRKFHAQTDSAPLVHA